MSEIDGAYRTMDSPVGRLLIAATERGVVRVAFEREGFDDVLETLSVRIGPRIEESPARLDVVARELDQYFQQSRQCFSVPVDPVLSSGFRQKVQLHLITIPYGSTASYKQVAEAVGNPNAVRAVGTACATNPLPIVLPCHRIIRSDGGLGGYLGGMGAKKILLGLEGLH